MAAAALAAVCATGAFAAPLEVEAASVTEKILYGTAAMLFVSNYYSRMDDHNQLQLLDECQKETGVYEDPAADARVQDVYQRIRDTGTLKRDYKIYVSPQEDINAFMSLGGVMCVDKGTLDTMDDDELAYIMAHEVSHGELRHNVDGVKKRVGLITALNIYLGGDATVGQAILANVAGNYVANAVFTKDQEKQADDRGFEYTVEAGYNPGAPAAAMQVLKDKYGESSPTGLKAVLAPGNHPKTSDRINKNVKRMVKYSGDHVKVDDGWIVVNGEKAFKPAASGNYTDLERTYLTAGKLAKVYHAGNVPDAVYRGNTIYCGSLGIYTTNGSENGLEYTAALNKGISKDRGQAVKDDFEIDETRQQLEKQKKEAAEQGSSEAEQ